MKDIEDFLILNGFEKVKENIFKNDKCTVSVFDLKYYSVGTNPGVVFSDDLNIYWLIGYLTYYNLMDRNYKDLKS